MKILGGLKRAVLLGLAAFIVASQLVIPVAAYKQSLTSGTARNTAQNLTVGELEFTGITFWDYSDSIRAFGLSGFVRNSSSSPISFSSSATYYSAGGTLIALSVNHQYVPAYSAVAYTQMSNLDIIKDGYSVSDISYYTIDVDTDEEAPILSEEDINTPSKYQELRTRYDYLIDSYDINVVVNENNTYNITEKIGVYFNKRKHGIFRTLPLRAKYERLDGSSSNTRLIVSDVRVDGASFTTSVDSGEMEIKIGDANIYVEGPKEYTISYTYNFGDDKLENADEFYLNLIGTDWNDTVIGNVSFSIEMPKEFEASKLGFSSGKYGSTQNDSVIFLVDGTKISGSYNGILGPREALTVRIELPEGYWQDTISTIYPYEYLMFIIPIACVVIAFFLWLIFGNDEQVVTTVEFYPPEGINSLDAALIWKGKVDSEDVSSLLFYLASKGYIGINEKEDNGKRSRSSDNKYEFVKLKEYDGDNTDEKDFLNSFFRGGSASTSAYNKEALDKLIASVEKGDELTAEKIDEVRGKGGFVTVTMKQLKNRFYVTAERIARNTNKAKDRYFNNTTWAKVVVVILAIVSFASAIIIQGLASGNVETPFMVLFLAAFYAPFFIVGFSIKGVMRVIWLGFTTLHCSAFFISILSEVEYEPDGMNLYGLICAVVCTVIIILIAKYIPKRTSEGNAIYGRLKGLREFMVSAEKSRLEHMLATDPNYAYNLLPYAAALGVSKKWMKRFEGMLDRAPDWYTGSHFSYRDFNDTIGATTRAMISSPASSGGGSSGGGGSGGGSSGGGSSGGGGGGGGGGSW